VTVSNAARARQGGPAGALAAGALLAGSVSCLRTLALAMAVSPAVGALLWPGLLGAAAGLGLLVLLPRGWAGGDEAPTNPGNPFEIGAVLRRALLLAAVGALARLGAEHLGAGAVLALAAVTGLADVDAVTLSVRPSRPRACRSGWRRRRWGWRWGPTSSRRRPTPPMAGEAMRRASRWAAGWALPD
jgi:uncharacterized membrane protein (DUF4010 family)